MKLLPQNKKNHKDLSKFAVVLQALAKFSGMAGIVFFAVLYVGSARAGFCWVLDETGSCDVYGRNGTDEKNHNYGVINNSSSLNIPLEKIQFRSDCHNPSRGCNGQDWVLMYLSIEHIKPDGTTGSINPAQLDITVPLNGSREIRNNWRPGTNNIRGESSDLFSLGMSGVISMVFNLPKGQVQQLEHGEHEVIIKIRGRDREDVTVNRDLSYILRFSVEESVRVKISGLGPFDLGVFPYHDEFDDQNVCVYASVDNQVGVSFKIQASSGNGGNSFYLRDPVDSTAPVIGYRPRFAQGANVSRNDGSVFDLDGTVQDRGLIGSHEENCSGGRNMTLFVELTETFETLSTLPAGQYTDVLTLTVSAD